jgi:hypothetical protein
MTDTLNINKDLIPLFHPLDWELKIKNLDEIIINKTPQEILDNPKLTSFLESIEINLREKHRNMLVRIDNPVQKTQLEDEFIHKLEQNILNKYNQLQELLSNGSNKLLQKQNANKYLTDVIDRDENIKLACMNSLLNIYKSFLNPILLQVLILCLDPDADRAKAMEKGLDVIYMLTKTNPHTQKEEFVFSYTHTLLSDRETFVFLDTINSEFKVENKVELVENDFKSLYNGFFKIYKTVFETKTERISVDDSAFLTKIYISFIQDFFIFYVKGSGALYLLFTTAETHKLFVESSEKIGDLFNLSTYKGKCMIKKDDEEISLFDYFNNLNLGNSDWDLNLCINPGLYEKNYNSFIKIYSSLLYYNRRSMYITRERFFINNQAVMDSVDNFYKQVNYDYLIQLHKTYKDTGEEDKFIDLTNNEITIDQTEFGIAFSKRNEVDSTIYRIVSDKDVKKHLELEQSLGKNYNNPWLGSEPDENEIDICLDNIIKKKKTYENVYKYIKDLFNEESSTSIKYAYDNKELDKRFENIPRNFYIQYNDSIDAFGLLRMSFLGKNTIKNNENSSTAGAGELLDISFIKDFNEMKSDWEHKDLLINGDSLPLVDYWDIIMDLNITIKDNILMGKTKKINKRINRLKFLQNILCCKENIQKNVDLLAAYYAKNKTGALCHPGSDNCYWDNSKILDFLQSDDRRMKKFGILLLKLQQVVDYPFYYPYNSNISTYIENQLKKQKIGYNRKKINNLVQKFGHNKISEINTDLRYNKKFKSLSKKIQNEHKFSPYMSNLISKLYKYCDKELRVSINNEENKFPSEVLLQYFNRGESFIIPTRDEYLRILGIYFLHLNKYKESINFLIDQIFLGKNNITNKKNFELYLNTIVSCIDIITGNFFGFSWIIYKEELLSDESKNLLFSKIEDEGEIKFEIKSRPYIDKPMIIEVQDFNSKTHKCFFTSLILDYYINIYEQLLSILAIKEINNTTYIKSNIESNISFFDDLFKNMITDMHIFEYIAKTKCLNDQNLALEPHLVIYNFNNAYKKAYGEDYQCDSTILQITFMPQLRNNAIYIRNKHGETIYDKSLLDFFDDDNHCVYIISYAETHLGYSEERVKVELELEPGVELDKKSYASKIINDLFVQGVTLYDDIFEIFSQVKNVSDINSLITSTENQELFDKISFDYNDTIINVKLSIEIGFLNSITRNYFAISPFFIYLICAIKYIVDAEEQKKLLLEIYEEYPGFKDDQGTAIILHQHDSKFYLYNILNDNFRFYKSGDTFYYDKNSYFYYSCKILDHFSYKTFVPISRLFYKKDDVDNEIFEYDNCYINLHIIADANKKNFYLNLLEMTKNYFENSFLDKKKKRKIYDNLNEMYGKINIILDSQQTGPASGMVSSPASGMVSSIASEPLPSFFDKIEIIDYNNDFIGTILYDIFESNLNIVKKELPKISIPIGFEKYRFIPEKEKTYPNIDLRTINKKYTFSRNLTIIEGPIYKTFISLKDYMGISVQNTNLLTNIDINTANQFLMTNFLQTFYKILFTDIQNATRGTNVDVYNNIKVSVDPCTIVENIHINDSDNEIFNKYPVYPIEITMCCNENNFYKNILKQIIKRYIQNIKQLEVLLLDHNDIVFYNYIVYVVNIMWINNDNLEYINKNSLLSKGKYFRRFSQELLINDVEIVVNTDEIKETLKLSFFVVYRDNINKINIGSIILSSSDNLYKYSLNTTEIGNSIFTNIIGYPIFYNNDVFKKFLKNYNFLDQDIEALAQKFSSIIDGEYSSFCSMLWNQQINAIYISPLNKNYKYYKIIIDKKITETGSRNIETINKLLVYVAKANILAFKDKFEVYKNYIGINLNENLLDIWNDIIINMLLYPLFVDSRIASDVDIDLIDMKFLPPIKKGVENIYNDYRLLREDIDLSELIAGNFRDVTIDSGKLKKNPILTLSRGGGDEDDDNGLNVSVKQLQDNGDDHVHEDDIMFYLSINSFNESIIVNTNQQKTNKALLYSDDVKNIDVQNITQITLGKYGTNFYYEPNIVSQVDEGFLVSINIDQLSLEGIQSMNYDEIMYAEIGDPIVELNYKIDTEMEGIDDVSMFNIINNYSEKTIKKYDVDDDILWDYSNYDGEHDDGEHDDGEHDDGEHDEVHIGGKIKKNITRKKYIKSKYKLTKNKKIKKHNTIKVRKHKKKYTLVKNKY